MVVPVLSLGLAAELVPATRLGVPGDDSFEPVGLLGAHPTVFFPPTIIGLFANVQGTADLHRGFPLAQ